MAYKLKEEKDLVTVLVEDPEIYETFNQNEFTDLCNELGSQSKDVKMDLSKVGVVDSLFIGVIVKLQMKLKQNGQKLLLCGAKSYLRDIFEKLNIAEFTDLPS